MLIRATISWQCLYPKLILSVDPTNGPKIYPTPKVELNMPAHILLILSSLFGKAKLACRSISGNERIMSCDIEIPVNMFPTAMNQRRLK